MNRKAIYYFLGKCLVHNENHRIKQAVSESLSDRNFPWELFVEIGSNHLIITAVYQRLIESGISEYLPDDLQLYLNEVNSLNLERNKRILVQVRQINQMLTESGIRPVFIKGSGAILDGLYQHPADRMTADIDCLIPLDKGHEVTHLLINSGYVTVKPKFHELPTRQHFHTLYKSGETSIDLHFRPVIEPFSRLMAGWEDRIRISATPAQNEDAVFVLSHTDQVLLNFLHCQMQDRGQFFANVPLRSAYDMYLLLMREDVSGLLLKTHHRYKGYLNNYLAMVSALFQPCIPEGYRSSLRSSVYIVRLEFNKTSRLFYRTSKSLRTFAHQIFHYSSIFIKAIYNKEYRFYLSTRLRNSSWYRSHLHTLRNRFLK